MVSTSWPGKAATRFNSPQQPAHQAALGLLLCPQTVHITRGPSSAGSVTVSTPSMPGSSLWCSTSADMSNGTLSAPSAGDTASSAAMNSLGVAYLRSGWAANARSITESSCLGMFGFTLLGSGGKVVSCLA